MLGWFRKKRAPHPLQRELRGLLSCVLAFHRAAFEDHVALGIENPTKRLSGLRSYVEGCGEIDPFSAHVIDTPLGALDEPLFVEALYRIETAGSIAWALNLIDGIPHPSERVDRSALIALFPLQGDSNAAERAIRRSNTDLEAELSRWSTITATAREARDREHNESTALGFSRSYERTRGLLWLVGDSSYVEDMVPP